ncbi:unnamed protein product [Rhizophagus irregularis]|uniref:Arrestin C-terminal-like domain-containing protein n=1 Tax=Rhizophagus irregularis TaxID=588596 RepID=A0A2N1NSB8_9GLOM|nr:hypothetical protein RhiirC2_733450 [Rhizophagus irregularis]CAB4374086.1 unnamed protein product [Rhizophagus irregularis]CAB5374227.1 unnamed protein product [Rhizophagus irregularis]
MASSSSSSSISTSISTSILSSSILSSTESSLPHKHHHTHDNEKAKYYLSKFRNIILQSSSNLQIRLIEPILYFQGNPEESLGCFMRGELIMNLSKPTKIKRIEMKFIGRMKTYWPQCKSYYGSHKNRNELCEECELINHNWTFLPSPIANSLLHPSSSLQDNNYLLPAGIYTYPFELFLPGTLPETIQAQLGNVSYKLQATVIKAKLSPNLHTSHHVTIIRDLSEESNSQGIAISRDWLDLINFEITIPNKAYSIGDSINIDFKTIPQVKRVQVIGLRIELNEQSIYRSRGQKNIESKILSVYRINNNNNNSNSDKDNNEIILDDIFYHKNFIFPLPKCSNYIHISCTWPSITISHSLKFHINVKVPIKSKMTGNFTNKFKKEVIEIDVPITLLSCRCADNLPQYDESWSNLNQDYSHNLNDLPPAYETSIADKRRTTNLSVINESIINTSINNSIQRHSFHQ